MKSLHENFSTLIEDRAGNMKLKWTSDDTWSSQSLSILIAQLRGVPNSWEIELSTLV